ncbi:hypothetical protein V5O48_012876 [Marasmius crinis-equi]|uniref:Uncharacterized protein n=1 Tax=Marasmius crinis-equi TaxID=585013 RepID=A0ABR3F203_9AGAR
MYGPAKRPAPDSNIEERSVRQRVEVKVEAAEETPATTRGLQAEVQSLQQRSEEIQKMNQEYLKAMVDTSNKVVQEQDEAAARIRHLELELDTMKTENAEMESKMKEAELRYDEENKKASEDFDSAKQAAKTENEKLNVEVAALKTKLQETESKHEEEIRKGGEKYDAAQKLWVDKARALQNKCQEICETLKNENQTLKAELEKLKEWKRKAHELFRDESMEGNECNRARVPPPQSREPLSAAGSHPPRPSASPQVVHTPPTPASPAIGRPGVNPMGALAHGAYRGRARGFPSNVRRGGTKALPQSQSPTWV